MIVRIGFYCIQEGKSYNQGDKYTGKRTDIAGFMEKAYTPKTKNKNAAPKTKNK